MGWWSWWSWWEPSFPGGLPFKTPNTHLDVGRVFLVCLSFNRLPLHPPPPPPPVDVFIPSSLFFFFFVSIFKISLENITKAASHVSGYVKVNHERIDHGTEMMRSNMHHNEEVLVDIFDVQSRSKSRERGRAALRESKSEWKKKEFGIVMNMDWVVERLKWSPSFPSVPLPLLFL